MFSELNINDLRMPALMRSVARIAVPLGPSIILLWPAFWNGFPLLEYDTGGYLARWFEATLVPSRSTTYGLFLTAGAPLDFWPVVILQAIAAAWIMGLLLRVHRFRPYPAALVGVVAILAGTTALPWLASELLTDIFAGLAVLAFHVLLRFGERTDARERAALMVFIAFAISTHSATYAVLLALCLAALVYWLFDRKLVSGAALARTGIAMALGAAMLLAANYFVVKRLAWTPGGYGIAFGRMLQDGIVARYLDQHCPDARLKLCRYRHELPRDADEFLWDNAVFNRLGRFAGLGAEMRTIVVESVRDYPAMQLKAALAAAAKQLVAVGTGEGIVRAMWHTHWIIEHFTPAAASAMHAARQQNSDLRFALINAVHEPVAWVAMAFLPLLIALGWYRTDYADLGHLAATIAVALLANAAFCGVISNPHDRYGSRIVWIAVFAAVLAVWRGIVARITRPPSRSPLFGRQVA